VSQIREYDGESRFDGEGRMMVGHWLRNDKVDDSCICDKRVRSTLAHACRRGGRCPGGRKKGWHWIKIKRSKFTNRTFTFFNCLQYSITLV
jgi:hypothetical protein